MDIFESLDYRQFLKDFYDEQKAVKPFFSYRYMAVRIDMDAGYLVKVMQKSCHIAERSIAPLCDLLKFTTRQREYFESLVAFNKARSEVDVKRHFERLLSLRGPSSKLVDGDGYEYYATWHHAAIRAVLGVVSFDGDYGKLGSLISPSIGARDAKASVLLLERLGFIRPLPDGSFELADAVITTGPQWRTLAVRTFQREAIRLAGESLERHPPAERDISTVTVALCSRDLDLVREQIAALRSTILRLAEETKEPDRVYELNLQLFPLSARLTKD